MNEMKKWIILALFAGLALVSCHKTIIEESEGFPTFEIYTNDLEVDCVISWKYPYNLEEEATTRKVLPGESYIQITKVFPNSIRDEQGDCRPLDIGKDIRFTFGDGVCFSLDQADDEFWKSLPQYRQDVKKRESGAYREVKIEIFLSDIHALAVKQQEDEFKIKL